MRALFSLIVGTLMLNHSVHAGSSPRSSEDSDQPESSNENVEIKPSNHSWRAQEMEEVSREEDP